MDPHIHPDQIGDKLAILDINAKTRSGETIHIEIQLHERAGFIQRILYYWAKLYEKQLAARQPYTELRKVITICITDFECTNIPYYHGIYHVREDRYGHKLLDELEIHLLELPKLSPNEHSSALERWLTFLKYESDSLIEAIAEHDADIKKAVSVLDYVSQDKEARRLYELREKALHEEASLIEEGRLQEKREIARSLIQQGVDIKVIAKATGLSEEAIKQMQ